jgi:hypothetical protein
MRHKSGTVLQLALVFLLTGVLAFVGLNALDATATPSVDKPDKPEKLPPGEPDWQVAIRHVESTPGSHVYGESDNVDGTYAIYDYYDDGKVDVRFVENPPGHINAKRNVLQLWISDDSPGYSICMGSMNDMTACWTPLPMLIVECTDPFCYPSPECIFPEYGCLNDFLRLPQPYTSYYFLMAFGTDIEIEQDLPDSSMVAEGEFAFYVRYKGGYNADGVEELHSIRCTVPAKIKRENNVWITFTDGTGSLECWEYYMEKTGKGKVQARTRIAQMTTLTGEPFTFTAFWTKLN